MKITECRLSRRSLAEEVADHLEEMILEDSSGLRTKLPSEQMLMAAFHVSRTVIREAIGVLKGRGLLKQKIGASSCLKIPDSFDLSQTIRCMVKAYRIPDSDILSARMQIELASSQLMDAEYLGKISSAELDCLKELNFQAKACCSDWHRRAELDLDFHSALVDLSRNQLLKIFFDSLRPLLLPLIEETLHLPKISEDGIAFHQMLLKNLESGKPVSDKLKGHLLLSVRNYEVLKKEQEK